MGAKARRLMTRGGMAGQLAACHPGAGPARAVTKPQAEAICPAATTLTVGISSDCDSYHSFGRVDTAGLRLGRPPGRAGGAASGSTGSSGPAARQRPRAGHAPRWLPASLRAQWPTAWTAPYETGAGAGQGDGNRRVRSEFQKRPPSKATNQRKLKLHCARPSSNTGSPLQGSRRSRAARWAPDAPL